MTSAQARPYGWKFSAPVLLAPALNPINTTMIAVGLAPIAHAVNVPTSTVVWLVAGLYLVSAVTGPAAGRIADLYGARRLMMWGLVAVLLGGIIPSLDHTFLGALIARLLIGLGTSTAYPASLAALREQEGRTGARPPTSLLSGISLSGQATAALGPVLGGVLIQTFGWQSIFLVNVPLALLVLALAWLGLPADSARVADDRSAASGHRTSVLRALDPLGVMLFGVAITSGLLFLLELRERLFWLLPLCALALVMFIWWERRSASPFIDVRLLGSNAPLMRTFIRMFIMYTALYLTIYGASQWVQSSVGVNADLAGLLQFPSAALAIISSVVVARNTRIKGALTVSTVLIALGAVGLLVITSHSELWMIALVVAVFGIPQGMGSVSNQAAMFSQTPPSVTGVAAGLSRTSGQLGAIAASAAVGILFGQAPSDEGMHSIGWVILVLAALSLLLTVMDRSLPRGAART